MLRSVDLPAPLGPATTSTRPCCSVPLTAASTLRLPKRLLTPRNSTETPDMGPELTTSYAWFARRLRLRSTRPWTRETKGERAKGRQPGAERILPFPFSSSLLPFLFLFRLLDSRREAALAKVFPVRGTSPPLASPADRWALGRRGRRARRILLLVLLSRLLLLPDGAWEQDEALMACGVLDFDPARHMPLPPGFPLWVFIGKVVRKLAVGGPPAGAPGGERPPLGGRILGAGGAVGGCGRPAAGVGGSGAGGVLAGGVVPRGAWVLGDALRGAGHHRPRALAAMWAGRLHGGRGGDDVRGAGATAARPVLRARGRAGGVGRAPRAAPPCLGRRGGRGGAGRGHGPDRARVGGARGARGGERPARRAAPVNPGDRVVGAGEPGAGARPRHTAGRTPLSRAGGGGVVGVAAPPRQPLVGGHPRRALRWCSC